MIRNGIFGLVVSAMISLVCTPGIAQRGGRGGPAAGQTVEKIKMLKPNLYEITGGGANTLVRLTNQGLIVVDTKNPSVGTIPIMSLVSQPFTSFQVTQSYIRLLAGS